MIVVTAKRQERRRRTRPSRLGSIPSTSESRVCADPPVRSGETVRKSSSIKPAAANSPNVCGPASNKISRWPRSCSARRTTLRIDLSSDVSGVTSTASGTRLRSRAAPVVDVRTDARSQAPGVVHRSRRCRSGSRARDARVVREGVGARQRATPKRGERGPETRYRSASREASRSRRRTTSASARSRPMTKRSASLPALISLFDCGTSGRATEPSSDATKFVYTVGPAKPSPPPYRRPSGAGSSDLASARDSYSASSGSSSVTPIRTPGPTPP